MTGCSNHKTKTKTLPEFSMYYNIVHLYTLTKCCFFGIQYLIDCKKLLFVLFFPNFVPNKYFSVGLETVGVD